MEGVRKCHGPSKAGVSLHLVGHGGDKGAVWLLFFLEHKRGQMCLCLAVGTGHRRACALLLSDGCMA